MKYVTTKYEEYPAPLTGKVIKFNPSCKEFCIIKTPTEQEFEQLINSYISKKIEMTWKELLKPLKSKTKPPQLRIFSLGNYKKRSRDLIKSQYITTEYYLKAFGEITLRHCEKKISDLSLDKQKKLAYKIKPSSTEEANAIFNRTSFIGNDPTGDKFINEVVKPYKYHFSESINALASLLFQTVADGVTKENKLKRQRTNKTAKNTLEFLSYLHNQGYILFPYIKRFSNTAFEIWMLHNTNAKNAERKGLINIDSYSFVQKIQDASNTKKGTKATTSFASSLVRASNFTKLEDTSEEFLNRLFEINTKGKRGISDPHSQDRKFVSIFNSFTNIVREMFNSTHDNPALKLNLREFDRNIKKNVEDLIDFSNYTNKLPELQDWSDLLTKFCTSVHDTQVSSRVAACRYFLGWISGLDDIPASPTEIKRTIHINDFADGNTLRNYLKNNYSNGASNRNLSMYRHLFDFCHDELYKNPNNRSLLLAYSNPIDIRWDSFKHVSKVGTTRKPIESRIMKELQNLIIEDDYAFPKKAFTFCYANLSNHQSGEYRHDVFCPSIANLLYLMLWIPLRKIQAQLLDSGEGDDFIYDFDKNEIVPNLQKIGTEKHRKEGLLQKLPSGALGITDILGLHITTNKTSDHGYDIPWACDELLNSLKNQYDWLKKYSPYPELRGRETLGRTMTKEGIDEGQKFYCLFRDPTAAQTEDQSKPSDKTRIAKAWGLLCQEAEKRLNQKLPDSYSKISLTREEDPAKSRYDIHSLRVSGITDLLEKGVPLGIVQKFVAGHSTYIMTLHYDNPSFSKVRGYLESARSKDSNVSDFSFIESELGGLTEHFVSNQTYAKQGYTPYDQLKSNAGIASIRLSGICPGGSCEEGGISTCGSKHAAVPAGNKGPSCPQCRFWVTGPMFLLGQVIEGNQLINKITKKVAAIDEIRESIIDAEDSSNKSLFNRLSGREDHEVRILSNMLIEWSERMKFYEASVNKLNDWIAYKENKELENSDLAIPMLSKSTEKEIRYGFSKSSNLELTHFITTVAEFLPEFIDSDDTSIPDSEQAITRFMAMNNLGNIMFRLNDKQKLHATNLMTDVLINSIGSKDAESLLQGDKTLHEFPALKEQVKNFIEKSEEKLFTLDSDDMTFIEAN